MGREKFQPRPGDLVVGVVELGEETPEGWERVGPGTVLREWTGDPADHTARVIGYVRAAV